VAQKGEGMMQLFFAWMPIVLVVCLGVVAVVMGSWSCVDERGWMAAIKVWLSELLLVVVAIAVVVWLVWGFSVITGLHP
jgi:hypothetical protein